MMIIGNDGGLGLFASIGNQPNEESAAVKDLTIDGAVIKGSGQSIGVVSGYIYGNIKNVTVKNANVDTTGKYVGGLIGMLDGTIDGCMVKDSTIKGKDQIGGAVGFIRCEGIKNSTVTGVSVTATEERAGGITGKLHVHEGNSDKFFISNNTVEGSATAPDKVGGLAAEIGAYDWDEDGELDATYEIKNNNIDVKLSAPAINPIGVLRNEDVTYFNNVTTMTSCITGNYWTSKTYSSNSCYISNSYFTPGAAITNADNAN